MKRVLSIVLFICLVIGLLPAGSLSVFAVENSATYKAVDSNFITCANPVYDVLNPQDITFNISGSTLKAITNDLVQLKSSDYRISGNTVTIREIYFSHIFNDINFQTVHNITLTFDFIEGNDPVLSIAHTPIRNILYGDANGDNIINVLDAILLKSVLIKKKSINVLANPAQSDMTFDGKLTPMDYLLLIRYIKSHV